jgi:hypothetical protein
MKRPCLFFAALLALTGCGPDKTDIARSEVNQLAEKWDGGPKFTAEGNDPWGQPYTAKVERPGPTAVHDRRHRGHPDAQTHAD